MTALFVFAISCTCALSPVGAVRTKYQDNGDLDRARSASTDATRCVKAPPPIPQLPDKACPIEIGSCSVFACAKSRGATTCYEGACYCSEPGQCNAKGDGKCSPAPPPPAPVPAVCNRGACDKGSCVHTIRTEEGTVAELNRRYSQDDDGVLIRGFGLTFSEPFMQIKCVNYSDSSTCAGNPLMSWSLMNHFAWNEGSKLNNLFPQDGGMIAIPATPMRCLFPSDAGTVSRQLSGCGKWMNTPVNWNQSDWCDPFPADFLTAWPGYNLSVIMPGSQTAYNNPLEWTGCALRDDQRAEMLKKYHEARQARTVTQAPALEGFYEIFGTPGSELVSDATWNEALADGNYWNEIVGTHVEAFFLRDSCENRATCKANALRVVNEYSSKFGYKPPLVGLNLARKVDPFFKV